MARVFVSSCDDREGCLCQPCNQLCVLFLERPAIPCQCRIRGTRRRVGLFICCGTHELIMSK